MPVTSILNHARRNRSCCNPYTAFGNPYLAYELPAVPRLIATYGSSDCSQRAAVKVWLGEIPATGELPVRMPRVAIKQLPVD